MQFIQIEKSLVTIYWIYCILWYIRIFYQIILMKILQWLIIAINEALQEIVKTDLQILISPRFKLCSFYSLKYK